MQTSWGDLAVSDAHVHFFSHRFFSLFGEQCGRTLDQLQQTLGCQMPPEGPEQLAADWVTELDRCGVSRAALIASLPGDQGSVAAAVTAYPDRFHGYFMLNPVAPDAPALVETALSGGALRGICLFPAMHRYSLHDERVTAVLQRAYGAVIFVHCGVLSVGIRQRLGLPSPFDMRFSNPLDVHAVAQRFSKLPFVIPHFGSGMFREALMLADLCPNVHLDTSSSNSWIKYQEAGCTLESVFRRALAVCGPQRLLFGTDSSFFPRGWHAAIFEQQERTLAAIGISAGDAAAIFGENLNRLFSRS